MELQAAASWLSVCTNERDGHEGSSSAQSEWSGDESNNDNDWDHESERRTSRSDSEEFSTSIIPEDQEHEPVRPISSSLSQTRLFKFFQLQGQGKSNTQYFVWQQLLLRCIQIYCIVGPGDSHSCYIMKKLDQIKVLLYSYIFTIVFEMWHWREAGECEMRSSCEPQQSSNYLIRWNRTFFSNKENWCS